MTRLPHTLSPFSSATIVRPLAANNHLHRIFGKIAVRSRTEAVVMWLGR